MEEEEYKDTRVDQLKEFVLLQTQKLRHEKSKERIEDLIRDRVEQMRTAMH